MIITCFVDSDAYELIYSAVAVDSIVRYRHGLNGPGEIVDYDTLPPHVQLEIYKKLKRELQRQRDDENCT